MYHINLIKKILLKEKRMLTLADLLEFVNCCINCLENANYNDLDLSYSTESKATTSKKKMNFTRLINYSAEESVKALFKNVVMHVKNINSRFCLIYNNTSHYLNQCFIFRKYSYPKKL